MLLDGRRGQIPLVSNVRNPVLEAGNGRETDAP